MTLSEMERRLTSLNIEGVAEESMRETAQEFIDLNTEQMYKGLDSQGQKIQPQYRSPKYARVKNELNPTPGYGTPDLKLTGAFYAGYQLRVQSGKVEEDSDVDYADDLTEKYGEQIWGLDPQNLVAYRTGPFKNALFQKVNAQLYE